MKVQKSQKEEIDQDTGLPIEQLRSLLVEAQASPTVNWQPEKIKKMGRALYNQGHN